MPKSNHYDVHEFIMRRQRVNEICANVWFFLKPAIFIAVGVFATLIYQDVSR